MKSNAYKCTNCGERSSKWSGQCQNCSEWNTLVKITDTDIGKKGRILEICKLSNVKDEHLSRVSTGFSEFDRVLGMDPNTEAGIAAGSVVLLSGDPGIGKSTLLLQVCANLTKSIDSIVYISAEESVNQIAIRSRRLSLDKQLDKVGFIHNSNVDSIILSLENNNIKFAIIDSIQTVMTSDINGMPGGLAQVKASATRLVKYAKQTGITMFIVGHINKDGNIAGPKILEHLVDTVIQIEGDKETELRIIRGHKNRFGATNEVGILKMNELGLEDVSNPSDYFLSKDNLPGVVRSAVLEGNRTLIIEVQALTSPTIYSLPKRVSEGIPLARLHMICAILQKFLKINLSDKDVYVNIAGGIKVKDRGLDLAIALAILSSYKNKILLKNMVSIGEIALSGTVNKTFGDKLKAREAKRMGYSTINSTKIKNISESWKLLKSF